ncbi:MAG: histidine kinase N-terminal 7TM domain-containing protein [Bacteroidota bacterium]
MASIHLFSFALFITAAITLGLFIYALTHRQMLGSRAFGLLMLASTFYIGGSGLELQMTSVQSVLFCLKIQYLGIAVIPAACILVAIRLTGRENLLKSWFVRIFLLVPAVVLLFYFTNPWHHLFYTNIGDFHQVSHYNVLSINKGPVYWFNLAYLNLSLLFAVILFCLKLRSGSIARHQAIFMIIGSAGPWIGLLVYQLGFTNGLDTGPFGFLITAPLFAWGVFANQVVFLLPTARFSVYESMGDPVIIVDHNNNLVDFNGVARNLFECLNKKALGLPVTIILSKFPEIVKIAEEPDPGQSQVKLNLSGSQQTFVLQKSPVVSRHRKEHLGWILLLHEITEQVKLMENLRENEERYRLIFENTPLGLMHYDTKGRITTFNDSFVKIIGSNKEVLTGLEMLHLPDKELVKAIVETLQGHTGYYEKVYKSTTAEKETPVRAMFAPIRGKDAKIHGGVGIIEDFTERLKAEQLIRYREDFEAILVDIALEFLSTTLDDMDKTFMNGLSRIGNFCGIDRSSIFRFDQDTETAIKMYEWFQEGILQEQDALDRVPMNIIPSWIKLLRESQIIYIPDLDQLSSDWGPEKSVLSRENVKSLITVPVETSDELIGFASFKSVREYRTWSKDEKALLKMVGKLFASVIKRKEVNDKLLEAKQKAEDASRVKSIFLAQMSHEIRTPLNGILGFAEVLHTEFDNPEVKNHAEVILESGKRLLQTLSQILDLSRVESGKMDLSVVKINANKVIDDILFLYTPAAKMKGLSIERVPDNFTLILELDEQLLRNALDNLINNAVKFTQKGGIRVTTGVETFRGIRYGCIRISDTGIGIPREFLNTIFEDFRQVSEGWKRNYDGTGLGLSLTRKFVNLSGGEIAVESEPDIGTTFILRFPI